MFDISKIAKFYVICTYQNYSLNRWDLKKENKLFKDDYSKIIIEIKQGLIRPRHISLKTTMLLF